MAIESVKTVKYIEATDEYCIEFSDEEFKELGWEPNDTLIWTDLGDGSYSIKNNEE